MKTIHVVAAVIEAVDEQGKEILFATQRAGRNAARGTQTRNTGRT